MNTDTEKELEPLSTNEMDQLMKEFVDQTSYDNPAAPEKSTDDPDE